MKTIKLTSIALAVTTGLILSGCGQVDEVSCRDVATLQKANRAAQTQGTEVKEEILDDLQEAGAENNCPGFDGGDDD